MKSLMSSHGVGLLVLAAASVVLQLLGKPPINLDLMTAVGVAYLCIERARRA